MKNSVRFLPHLVFLIVLNSAFAQAPKTLSYQGSLADSTGPLTGSHNLTFRIYDAASGGTLLWGETISGVVAAAGNVSVTLGKSNPINIQTVKPLWMGIIVDANPEVSPRVELSGSLYSIGLALPYSATVGNTINNGKSLIDLTYSGDSSIALLKLNYTSSSMIANPFQLNHAGQGAAMVLTQSGTLGTGGLFTVSNSANPQQAIRALTFGTGNAGSFSISNGANTATAMAVQTTGTGSAGSFVVNNASGALAALVATSTSNTLGSNGGAGRFQAIGGGRALTAEIANTSNSSNSFTATHAGVGQAAFIETTKTTNTLPALQVTSNSTSSPAINISHTGGGNAITANRPIQATQFIGDGSLLTGISGSGFSLPYTATVSASSAALEIVNTGSSYAAQFAINNPASGAHAVYATSNGSGNAASFYSNGPAGGGALAALQGGQGFNAEFNTANPSNNYPVLRASTSGGGRGLQVDMLNSGSSAAAIYISHSGSGNAITANRPIQATQFIGDGSLLTGISSGFTFPYSFTSSDGSIPLNITKTGDSFAARFTVDNASNNYPVIDVSTNGGGIAGAFTKTGGTSGAALWGMNSGLGASGMFYINNSANSNAALLGETNGTGAAGNFRITNAASSSPALSASTDGTGSAASFSSSNASSNGPVLFSMSSSNGSAIGALVFGTGKAGDFQIASETNSNYALSALTQGTGGAAAFTALNSTASGIALTAATTGLGNAAYFESSNTNGYAPAVRVATYGNGTAATFDSYKVDATFPAIKATTNATSYAAGYFENNGTGGSAGQAGTFRISSLTSNSAAIGSYQMGLGAAGEFNIQNTSNDRWAVSAVTNGTGPALIASQEGNGRAIKIVSGGLQYNVTVVSSSSISTRSAVYNLNSGGPAYSVSFSANEGDTFIAYNSTGSGITIAGISVDAGETKQFVYIAGAWRGL